MAKAAAKPHLPPRMRRKVTSSGKIYYYYDCGGKPRKWLALGADFYEALKQYADYEKQYNEADINERMSKAVTFKTVADRYVRSILSNGTLSVRTQKDYLGQLKFLLDFFGGDNPAPINDIQSVDIYEYLEWRKDAPVRANREISLFSVLFNWARRWGYTNNENPCRGIKKYNESPREVYVSDTVFWKAYSCAERHIQFMLLIAYLTGQRVADTIKMKMSDIKNNELWIKQNKTGTKIRVKIVGALALAIEALKIERGELTHDAMFTKNGRPVTYSMLRGGINRAREKAGILNTDDDFQFRDIRAKSATDRDQKDGIEAARKLLGHSTQSMTTSYIRNRVGNVVEPMEIEKNVEQE